MTTVVTIYYKNFFSTTCPEPPAAVCTITNWAFGSQKDVSQMMTEYVETEAWTMSNDCTDPLTYSLEEYDGSSWTTVSGPSIFTITYPTATTTLRVTASPILSTDLGVHTL